jgi:hypothetical protein
MNSGISVHIDQTVGLTMDGHHVFQLPDGSWKATARIGSIFGSEVDGECSGSGSTREAALAALAEDQKHLNESLWV